MSAPLGERTAGSLPAEGVGGHTSATQTVILGAPSPLPVCLGGHCQPSAEPSAEHTPMPTGDSALRPGLGSPPLVASASSALRPVPTSDAALAGWSVGAPTLQSRPGEPGVFSEPVDVAPVMSQADESAVPLAPDRLSCESGVDRGTYAMQSHSTADAWTTSHAFERQSVRRQPSARARDSAVYVDARATSTASEQDTVTHSIMSMVAGLSRALAEFSDTIAAVSSHARIARLVPSPPRSPTMSPPEFAVKSAPQPATPDSHLSMCGRLEPPAPMDQWRATSPESDEVLVVQAPPRDGVSALVLSPTLKPERPRDEWYVVWRGRCRGIVRGPWRRVRDLADVGQAMRVDNETAARALWSERCCGSPELRRLDSDRPFDRHAPDLRPHDNEPRWYVIWNGIFEGLAYGPWYRVRALARIGRATACSNEAEARSVWAVKRHDFPRHLNACDPAVSPIEEEAVRAMRIRAQRGCIPELDRPPVPPPVGPLSLNVSGLPGKCESPYRQTLIHIDGLRRRHLYDEMEGVVLVDGTDIVYRPELYIGSPESPPLRGPDERDPRHVSLPSSPLPTCRRPRRPRQRLPPRHLALRCCLSRCPGHRRRERGGQMNRRWLTCQMGCQRGRAIRQSGCNCLLYPLTWDLRNAPDCLPPTPRMT